MHLAFRFLSITILSPFAFFCFSGGIGLLYKLVGGGLALFLLRLFSLCFCVWSSSTRASGCVDMESKRQRIMSNGHDHPYQQLENDLLSESTDSELQRMLEQELETKSDGENVEVASADDEQGSEGNPKRKRYHRHSNHQIQEMEAFFKECPHPDEKQRRELSRSLGLSTLQVKFWFQNKRTQSKTQQERQDNIQLREENEKLHRDNTRLKEAIDNGLCFACGGELTVGELDVEGQDLRAENAKLKDEITRISGLIANYLAAPLPALSSSGPSSSASASGSAALGDSGALSSGGNALMGIPKPLIIELAVKAMEELVALVQLGEPLWMPRIDHAMEILNEGIYVHGFKKGLCMKFPQFKTEATRDTVIVAMPASHIIDIFMDVNRWASLFSNVVSRALPLEVFSSGANGNFSGALQLMSATFQLPTPLVPTRDSVFARYCKQHSESIWGVVDVSLDCLKSIPAFNCRRRPSGCLIQALSEGFSKVTWVEHVEVDDSNVADIYKSLVNSGLAFGAQRWLLTLERQCQRLASISNDISVNGLATEAATLRTNWLRLTETMVMNYCKSVSAAAVATPDQWTIVSGTGGNVRAMIRKTKNGPGCPQGVILNATGSFWLPAPAARIFDFLCDNRARPEWDILSNGGVIDEVSQIDNYGSNFISLLRMTNEAAHTTMTLLQESCTDATGAYVIYAPLDNIAMELVVAGANPNFITLLPSGFIILPDGPSALQTDGAGGSLLTVAFQILLNPKSSDSKLLSSVATIKKLLANTIDKITAAVSSETP